jgi:hypothetical protein
MSPLRIAHRVKPRTPYKLATKHSSTESIVWRVRLWPDRALFAALAERRRSRSRGKAHVVGAVTIPREVTQASLRFRILRAAHRRGD